MNDNKTQAQADAVLLIFHVWKGMTWWQDPVSYVG